MKKYGLLVFFAILVILMSACGQVGESEPVMEDEPKNKVYLTTGEAEGLKAELEEERKKDPIFSSLEGIEPPEGYELWEPGEELPDGITPEMEEMFYDYLRKEGQVRFAQTNYPTYAYFYGVHTPYKEGKDPGMQRYRRLIDAIASRAFAPGMSDMIWGEVWTEPWVIVRVHGGMRTDILEAEKWVDENGVTQYYPKWSVTPHYKWMLVEVVDVLRGEIEPGTFFALCPEIEAINEDLTSGEGLFLLSLSTYADGWKLPHEGEELPFYQISARGVHRVEDGEVYPLSDYRDVLQYQGLSVEEYLRTVLSLCAKYGDYNGE